MSRPYLAAWLRGWRLAARYFRFESEGFEHLARSRPALAVCYHGMPFPLDVFLLSVRIHDELGFFPRAIWASAYGEVPILRDLVSDLHGLYGPPGEQEAAAILARRELLIVCPGGLREALRPFTERYTLAFGARTGYLRLALRLGVPIVPIVATGTDLAYLGLIDGYRLSQGLLGTSRFPLWIGLGLGGFWPLALPFPVKIRQRIGPPVHLEEWRRPGEADEVFLHRAHTLYTGLMQSMLDDLRSSSGAL